MVVKETGNYNISVYQQSKRKFQNTNYAYSGVRLVVIKEKNGEFEYITSSNKSQSHTVFSEAHLESGLYYIAVKMNWENQVPKPVVLTSYGC